MARPSLLALLMMFTGLGACVREASRPEAYAGWPDPLAEMAVAAHERFDAPSLFAADLGRAVPGDVVIVDVRSGAEAAVSRIPGALVLPTEGARDEFVRNPGSAPVLVYCTVGWRSAEYALRLQEAGVPVWNLEGGLCGWALDGRELVDANGEPTRRIHAYSDDFVGCVPEGFEAVTSP